METAIDDQARDEVIATALDKLREHYVFPEVAARAAVVLSAKQSGGAYDGVVAGGVLAAQLTTDLREAVGDKHLRVTYFDEPQPSGDNMWEDPQFMRVYWAEARLDNHGWTKAERLRGNVGYLQIQSIEEAEETAETIGAAMAFLAHTSALILDVRAGRGGAPTGIAFLCSYFFGPTPVHLNDLYYRRDARTEQYWTLPYVPGRRYLDKPVFVLTDEKTFSGCEELAYNLQNLKRATVIGATTAGGANPVDLFQINDRFAIQIPTCRAVSPISGTNWEGIGVSPDVAVPPGEALETAHRAALHQVQAALQAQPPPHTGGSSLLDEVTTALADYGDL